MASKIDNATNPAGNPVQHMFSNENVLRERKIALYDFKRPDKFSSDQIRTVGMVHETFARLISAFLSARLHLMTHARVASVDQLTYEEFIRSIPCPSTMSIIAMDPLKGTALLEIDPSLTFTMIDRLFGGSGKASEVNRDLTDIEASLMEETIEGLLGSLREAWSTVVDMRPRVSGIETNPQFAQIVPPPEMAIIVGLETKISGASGEIKGMIHICIPYLTIEPLIGRLSSQYWYTTAKKMDKPNAAVAGLKLGARLYHRTEVLSLKQLNRLKKGSRIRLPGYADGETFLLNGGQTVLKMKREMGKGKKGITFLVEQNKDPANTDEKMMSAKPHKDIENALSGMARTLASEFKTGIESVNTEIGRIRKKQDELAEQIYFEASVKDTRAFDESARAHNRPFGFISMAHLDFLALSLPPEHPQTIALILAHLPPEMASQLLMRFPEQLRPDLTERIALLDRTAPESLHACERVLKKKLENLHDEEWSRVGGVEGVVNILNASPRNVEKSIIDILDVRNARLSEEIKKRMFVFEDITLLDKKTVRKIIASLTKEELAVALMKTISEVKAFANELLTNDEQAEIKRIQEAKSPLRILDIEEAQRQIVNRIREMEERGEIVVARPGETI